MKKIVFYVGGDNETHKVDFDAVIKLARQAFSAFTLTKGTGFWAGCSEETAIVTVVDTPDSVVPDTATVNQFVTRACAELDQACILIEESEVETRYGS